MKRVVVHIEHLVLRGFRNEDQQAITAGLQQELARVFADRQAMSQLRSMANVPRLRVGGVRMEHGSKAKRIGENVARGIGKEITR